MTKKQSAKKITDILHHQSSSLGELLKKVFQYNQLELNLEDFIAPEVASHVQLGAYQKGILILLADSGSWATKLNYMIPELREKLRQHKHWAGLKNITIKVAPHIAIKTQASQAVPTSSRCIPISTASQESLIQAANLLSDSKESAALKKILLKLAESK